MQWSLLLSFLPRLVLRHVSLATESLHLLLLKWPNLPSGPNKNSSHLICLNVLFVQFESYLQLTLCSYDDGSWDSNDITWRHYVAAAPKTGSGEKRESMAKIQHNGCKTLNSTGVFGKVWSTEAGTCAKQLEMQKINLLVEYIFTL